MTPSVDDRVRRIVGLMIARDPRTAAELDLLAAEIREIAARCRADFGEPGTRDTGGAGDRVTMTLIGPDGLPKSHHDTGVHP